MFFKLSRYHEKFLYYLLFFASHISTFSRDETEITLEKQLLIMELQIKVIMESENSYLKTLECLLIISNVKSTCGCTILKNLKTNLPGESEKIQVKYDTKELDLSENQLPLSNAASSPTPY